MQAAESNRRHTKKAITGDRFPRPATYPQFATRSRRPVFGQLWDIGHRLKAKLPKRATGARATRVHPVAPFFGEPGIMQEPSDPKKSEQKTKRRNREKRGVADKIRIPTKTEQKKRPQKSPEDDENLRAPANNKSNGSRGTKPAISSNRKRKT